MDLKRKRMSLSIQEKSKILEEVEALKGLCVALAKKLEISVSTLNTIVRNKDSIIKNVNESGHFCKKRKYASYSKYVELEEIMKNWFKTVRASNISVSSVLLREKALNVADKLSIENFSRLMVGLIDSKSVTILFSKVVYGEGNAVLEESVREWQEGKLKDPREGVFTQGHF